MSEVNVMGRRVRAGAVLVALVVGAFGGTSGETQAGREYNLTSGARIVLSPGWVELRNVETPPAALLVSTAPKMIFSEIFAAQNTTTQAVMKFGASNNPYMGRDATSLDTQMHAGDDARGTLLDHLFAFYYSPPKTCLAEGYNRFLAGQGKADAADDTTRPTNSLPEVRVKYQCRYAPVLPDLFAEMLSEGLVF